MNVILERFAEEILLLLDEQGAISCYETNVS